ncbi:MAG: ABC transporter ATP-binding protein [Desulfatitalea sp.]|nr:ABC transporter ATP-binding protein [Desulfatitalea sp.]
MLEINNLSIAFKRYNGWLGRTELRPIRCLDLEIEQGRIVSVVGESGAGKSLLAHAILGLLPANARVSGELRFDGHALTPGRIRRLRGREIALIPQSTGFLNPLKPVGAQVARAARLSGKSAGQALSARDSAFAQYGLDDAVKTMFPYQISGGMARRVLTAAATVGQARLILADEPTSGMDGDNSRKALSSLRALADQGRCVLLITHDIEAAIAISDSVAVFRNGVTIEAAAAADFKSIDGLRHPYTRQLVSALPEKKFIGAVNGRVPITRNGGQGCAHYGECPLETQICYQSAPHRKQIRNGWARCHHA